MPRHLLQEIGGRAGEGNLLILREYASLAAMEANVENADAFYQQSDGTDQAQMQGYEDRSKYCAVVGTRSRIDSQVGN